MKKFAAFFLILFCTAGTAAGYTRITSSSGHSPRWTSTPISYWINDRGSSQIANGSEFIATHAAFQSWQNVATADVRFEYRGTTSTRTVGLDGMNLISFADDSTPLGSTTVAATFSFYRTDANSSLVTGESDIIFNPNFEFSTSGEIERLDIQGVLTHEIGHLLGLDHSGLVASVMVPFAAPSQTDQRTLMYDDIAGVSEIYPRLAVAVVGAIGGNVTQNGAGVFGAHIVAVDASGTPLVSTISQPGGDYLIRFLPPGAYRVYAEPLDLPVTEQHVGGGSTSFYRNLKTDFGTTYYGNVASLSEAQPLDVRNGATTIANIGALPRSATNLNLTRPGFAPRIERGLSATLRIGGEDITAGISITASNAGMVLGTPSFGGSLSSTARTSATMELTVLPSTPLGPKNIAVNRSGSASVASGALVVVDAAPARITVSPDSGPTDGSTSVTITGKDFRPGARVFFAGIPAAAVQIVDSGTIFASTPQNIPGPVNVQIVNTDGTIGTAARAYTYVSQPPSISRIFPLSGSPATTVTIEGAQFDVRAQNIEVKFNGVAARVVSATMNSIQTVVPFGAVTGPVTLSVFGQTVVGPEFAVLPAAISTNVAGGRYEFVDAGAGSGGTNLSFNSNDDAIAFTTLPFTLSLFRDIYLAGSHVSVATNGWISLESLATAEFQNASLPAQTVTRPGGSTGSVPPALIAPYWDDLIMRSGASTISTRTAGSAPNRRFVVQWSGMSILDEEGRDLNASVTFELILFEGSNDIQYVYQTLSGPRSDGSSATIGAQDAKRGAAFQTSFNQPAVRNLFFLNYRFRDGVYTQEIPDTTPPVRPTVSDGGVTTSSRTELTATWSSEDPESGIQRYEYAIGRTPAGTDVRSFSGTTQNSVVATGLNLENGVTYYFAVRAVNNAGLVSELGVSDGIRVDVTFQPITKVIPWIPQDRAKFSGIALQAPAAMSVLLKALDNSGSLLAGTGIRNPVTVSLSAGQQYARLMNELFGLESFDGWVEVEASGPGLRVYTATGNWDMAQMDGTIPREVSSDFYLFYRDGFAVLVNPSVRPANVTMGSQTFSIPARSKHIVPLSGIVRVQSSEPLAAIERFSDAARLAMSTAVPVSSAQSGLVFPHAVAGAGYVSILNLANVTGIPQDVSITFGSRTTAIQLGAGSTISVSIAQLLSISADQIETGAVRVNARVPIFGSGMASLVGALTIENASGMVTLGARPASTELWFPHVAHGNGLFTGLAIATGDTSANIVIEVYSADGGSPRMATLTLGPNRQIGRVLNEFISSITTQMGGYIRIRSDQPVWAWEIYGSDAVMASGPPS